MDYKVDFSTVTTKNDRVAIIATKPLTKNETWIEMEKGELLMFDKGLPYADASKCEIVEKQGRGLTKQTSMIPDDVKSFDTVNIDTSKDKFCDQQ